MEKREAKGQTEYRTSTWGNRQAYIYMMVFYANHNKGPSRIDTHGRRVIAHSARGGEGRARGTVSNRVAGIKVSEIASTPPVFLLET